MKTYAYFLVAIFILNMFVSLWTMNIPALCGWILATFYYIRLDYIEKRYLFDE